MDITEYALIVAGGKGTRVQSNIPKQFLTIAGKPIVIHTVEAFFRYANAINVVVVIPNEDLDTWYNIRDKFLPGKKVLTVEGGPTRFQSVKNGLNAIAADGLVAIHDGVRPLVTETIIRQSFFHAANHGSAIASVPLKESIRMIGESNSKALDRSAFRMIQTPQTFGVKLIKNAYDTAEDPALTDDASVAERAGHPIFLFEGSYENLKVTTPEDIVIAEALLKRRTDL